VCDKLLPKVESGLQKIENTLGKYLPKAQARAAKLRSEGETARAQRLDKGISWVQSHESEVNTRLSKIEAKCGEHGSTGSTGSTGSGS